MISSSKTSGFAYNSGETVLKDVSFTAKQGEVTALIGPSGGGKSTAAKLAARFWDVGHGVITVGGTDVKTVDPEKLLSAYSIVFQDVTLFNNTVMENIRIGRQGASDEEVMRAASEARCDEFVSRLPNGYQTMIGENGSTLSGGEPSADIHCPCAFEGCADYPGSTKPRLRSTRKTKRRFKRRFRDSSRIRRC